jgi:hypothetical protein
MSGKTYQASGITVVRDTGSTERLLVDGRLVPRCACTFVIEPTKLAEKAVPHPFALGCLPGSACGLYLMDKSTSQGDCGGAVWRARDEVHPEAAANGREVFRALYNQPSHTSGCGDGKNLRYLTAHPINVERAGTNKAGYQRVRCTHESDSCFVG